MNNIDSSGKKFGYNEHPLTTSNFFCICYSVVSGTQMSQRFTVIKVFTNILKLSWNFSRVFSLVTSRFAIRQITQYSWSEICVEFIIFSEEKEKVRESITKKKAKRKGPLQNPAGGRRSKRRKSEVSASSPSDSHSDSEEESGEEDYSYHYDGDTCEAYDCTRPVSDKVSWVSKMYFKWRLF